MRVDGSNWEMGVVMGANGGGIPRRTAIKMLGRATAAAAVAGSGVLAGCDGEDSPRAEESIGTESLAQQGNTTVKQWLATRGSRYLIAHRGSGDVLPEHSMQAYQAAYDWGAKCMEISVGMTSDGVLICMHDRTYDRTTTGSGAINEQSSSVLEKVRIWQPRLGTAWTVNPPRVPLFEDVLAAFGGRVVLAVEAKLRAAYTPMMAMVERYGLRDSVIVKAHFASQQWAQAKASGYPVFCYFGSAKEALTEKIIEIAAQLDPQLDCLVLPGFVASNSFLPDETVAAAVATGVPVWAFPLHRRSDAQHFFDRGVQGAICSSYGYLAGSVPAVRADSWSTQAVSSGELTLDPSVDDFAATFTSAGELILAAQGIPHFVTMGQCGPLPDSGEGYSISVDVCWRELPASPMDGATIAFGHADDSYYGPGGGGGNGYHAMLRANGSLALYRHGDAELNRVGGSARRRGAGWDERLAPSAATAPLRVGEWANLRIVVRRGAVTVSRNEVGAAVTGTTSALPGGYFHVGRTAGDGVLSLRSLRLG